MQNNFLVKNIFGSPAIKQLFYYYYFLETGDLTKLKDDPFTLPEGISYRLKIKFSVEDEIVSGLKYYQVVSRKGIRMDKQSYLMGSYGPKQEVQEYLTPWDEAPKGLLYRGRYIDYNCD